MHANASGAEPPFISDDTREHLVEEFQVLCGCRRRRRFRTNKQIYRNQTRKLISWANGLKLATEFTDVGGSERSSGGCPSFHPEIPDGMVAEADRKLGFSVGEDDDSFSTLTAEDTVKLFQKISDHGEVRDFSYETKEVVVDSFTVLCGCRRRRRFKTTKTILTKQVRGIFNFSDGDTFLSGYADLPNSNFKRDGCPSHHPEHRELRGPVSSGDDDDDDEHESSNTHCNKMYTSKKNIRNALLLPSLGCILLLAPEFGTCNLILVVSRDTPILWRSVHSWAFKERPVRKAPCDSRLNKPKERGTPLPSLACLDAATLGDRRGPRVTLCNQCLLCPCLEESTGNDEAIMPYKSPAANGYSNGQYTQSQALQGPLPVMLAMHLMACGAPPPNFFPVLRKAQTAELSSGTDFHAETCLSLAVGGQCEPLDVVCSEEQICLTGDEKLFSKELVFKWVLSRHNVRPRKDNKHVLDSCGNDLSIAAMLC
eukprot:6323239-Amphidinium_carterae.1